MVDRALVWVFRVLALAALPACAWSWETAVDLAALRIEVAVAKRECVELLNERALAYAADRARVTFTLAEFEADIEMLDERSAINVVEIARARTALDFDFISK